MSDTRSRHPERAADLRMTDWDIIDAGHFGSRPEAGPNACGGPAGASSRAGQGCADQRCQPRQNQDQEDRTTNNPDPFQFRSYLHPESFDLLSNKHNIRFRLGSEAIHVGLDLGSESFDILSNKRHIRLRLGPEMIHVGLAGDTAGHTGMDGERDGFGLRLFKARIAQALDLGNRVKGGLGHGGFRLQGLRGRLGGLCPDFQPAQRWLRGSIAVVTAAVLATASFAREPQAWLDAVETCLVEASGHAIAIPGDPPVVFVFHGALSTLWMLDTGDLTEADDARVIATGTVLRDDGSGAKGDRDTDSGETAGAPGFRVLWRDGSVTGIARPAVERASMHAETSVIAGRVVTIAPGRHPLARAYDRLISEPLARPVAGLAAGSRFGTDGLVRPPDLPHQPHGAIFWQSHGERITLEMKDGTLVGVTLEALVQALHGSAPTIGEQTRGSGQ